MKEQQPMKEPIRKVELKDGTTRYRLVVDIGLDENGKRQQLTKLKGGAGRAVACPPRD